MRVLVIDGQRTARLDHADEVVHARTAASALAALEDARTGDRPFDEVWFDHDLDEADDAGGVVRALERWAWQGETLPLRTALVHAPNPVGARRLQDGLTALVPTYPATPRQLRGVGGHPTNPVCERRDPHGADPTSG